MEHSDRELTCQSCGKSFMFSAGEQAYFAQHGYQEPRRCKPCRAQRKAQAGEAPGDARRGPMRSANGNGNGNGNTNGNFARPQGGPPRARNVGFRPAAADDPNGYRAPGFQNDGRPGAYAIDYAGLPRDEEDDAAPGPGNAREGARERMGMRTSSPMLGMPGQSPRGPRSDAPRGMNGRGRDVRGTDPDAYRSPAFSGSSPGGVVPGEPGSRKARRASRMRHEATCNDCGVHAMVPFQPGPDRPAYCKPCYQVRKANGTAPIPPSAGATNTPSASALAPSAAPAPAPAASE